MWYGFSKIKSLDSIEPFFIKNASIYLNHLYLSFYSYLFISLSFLSIYKSLFTSNPSIYLCIYVFISVTIYNIFCLSIYFHLSKNLWRTHLTNANANLSDKGVQRGEGGRGGVAPPKVILGEALPPKKKFWKKIDFFLYYVFSL